MHRQRQTIPEGPVKEVWAQVGRGGGKTRAAVSCFSCECHRASTRLLLLENAVRPSCLAQNQRNRTTSVQLRPRNSKRRQTSKTNDHQRNQRHLSLYRTGSILRQSQQTTATLEDFQLYPPFADEVAFWWLDSDSANSDVEVLSAMRPGLARVPGSVLWVISSPHVTRGAHCTKPTKSISAMMNPIMFYFGKRQQKK